MDRLEAAIGAHLTELVERTDVVAVTSGSLFHMETRACNAASTASARRTSCASAS